MVLQIIYPRHLAILGLLQTCFVSKMIIVFLRTLKYGNRFNSYTALVFNHFACQNHVVIKENQGNVDMHALESEKFRGVNY